MEYDAPVRRRGSFCYLVYNAGVLRFLHQLGLQVIVRGLQGFDSEPGLGGLAVIHVELALRVAEQVTCFTFGDFGGSESDRRAVTEVFSVDASVVYLVVPHIDLPLRFR